MIDFCLFFFINGVVEYDESVFIFSLSFVFSLWFIYNIMVYVFVSCKIEGCLVELCFVWVVLSFFCLK